MRVGVCEFDSKRDLCLITEWRLDAERGANGIVIAYTDRPFSRQADSFVSV